MSNFKVVTAEDGRGDSYSGDDSYSFNEAGLLTVTLYSGRTVALPPPWVTQHALGAVVNRPSVWSDR